VSFCLLLLGALEAVANGLQKAHASAGAASRTEICQLPVGDDVTQDRAAAVM
jgi:hypothetical protein